MSRGHGEAKPIALALLLAGFGALFKILGGVLYGSRAVLIDGATCIGNLLAGIALYKGVKESLRPPDEDHPYGHSRLVLHGVLLVQVTYAFIAGFSAAILYYSFIASYEVGAEAPVYALIGTLFYAGSIIISRRQGYAGTVFAGFTYTEILEGVVTIAASYTAHLYGRLYDLAGGVLILSYLVYEIISESWRLGLMMSDYVDPTVTREVRRLLDERGFNVKDLRIRTIVPGHYHGDAVVTAGGMPYEVADLLVDEATHIAREKYNVDLVVHIDVEDKPNRRGSQ